MLLITLGARVVLRAALIGLLALSLASLRLLGLLRFLDLRCLSFEPCATNSAVRSSVSEYWTSFSRTSLVMLLLLMRPC